MHIIYTHIFSFRSARLHNEETNGNKNEIFFFFHAEAFQSPYVVRRVDGSSLFELKMGE